MEEGMIQASDGHDQRPLPAHASASGDTHTGGLVAGISKGDGGSALLGRIRECHVLDRLLESVWAGQSRVLVLRGEVGSRQVGVVGVSGGKGIRVSCRASSGHPRSEMALAYAGLHQLCAPVLDLRQRLPAPQRRALAPVFGLKQTLGCVASPRLRWSGNAVSHRRVVMCRHPNQRAVAGANMPQRSDAPGYQGIDRTSGFIRRTLRSPLRRLTNPDWILLSGETQDSRNS